MTADDRVGREEDGDPGIRMVGWQPVRRRAETVILVGADPRVPGGRSMRWRALRRAFPETMRCELWELGCDRWSRCSQRCAQPGVTGGPGGIHGVRAMPGPPGGRLGPWYYERTFCASHLGRLVAELTAAGVSTVVCSGLETARYVPELAAFGRLSVVFDLHNVETLLHGAIREGARQVSPYDQLYTDQHASFVAAAEREALSAAGQIWTCSEADRDLLAGCHGDALAQRTWVVPNAVDMPASPPEPAAEVERVCFTGTMDYFPNHAAAQTLAFEIAPLIDRFAPTLPVVIAGARADRWAALVIASRPLPPAVQVLADPPDISTIVRGSIMVISLRIGGGSRFKILEAFALGAPVVSTGKGVEGLGLVAGEHYLHADEPSDFATAVEKLIRDRPLRETLVHNGWSLARERYSSEALARAVGTALAAGCPLQARSRPANRRQVTRAAHE